MQLFVSFGDLIHFYAAKNCNISRLLQSWTFFHLVLFRPRSTLKTVKITKKRNRAFDSIDFRCVIVIVGKNANKRKWVFPFLLIKSKAFIFDNLIQKKWFSTPCEKVFISYFLPVIFTCPLSYYVSFGEFARCFFRYDKTEHLRRSSNQQWNNKFIQSPSNNVMLSTFIVETLLRTPSTKASYKQIYLKKFVEVFFLTHFAFTVTFTSDFRIFFSLSFEPNERTNNYCISYDPSVGVLN